MPCHALPRPATPTHPPRPASSDMFADCCGSWWPVLHSSCPLLVGGHLESLPEPASGQLTIWGEGQREGAHAHTADLYIVHTYKLWLHHSSLTLAPPQCYGCPWPISLCCQWNHSPLQTSLSPTRYDINCSDVKQSRLLQIIRYLQELNAKHAGVHCCTSQEDACK